VGDLRKKYFPGEVWIFSGTTYTHSEIWGITGDLVDKEELAS